MVPARHSVLAALFLIALAALGWRLLHLYSGPRPYESLLPQTRTFLTTALARDSSGLVHTGASAAAVQWGLGTARQNPAVLREFLSGLSVIGGRRTGAQIFVIFRGSSRGTCREPLAVTFTGTLAQARIQTISSDCSR